MSEPRANRDSGTLPADPNPPLPPKPFLGIGFWHFLGPWVLVIGHFTTLTLSAVGKLLGIFVVTSPVASHSQARFIVVMKPTHWSDFPF